jgi:hypothetical protein
MCADTNFPLCVRFTVSHVNPAQIMVPFDDNDYDIRGFGAM